MQLLTRVPGRQVILAFGLTIIVGALLLSQPVSGRQHRIPFVDALFTATSAVCVTGLTVVDTEKDYTRFGQIVILTLIQLGGLGVMTFMTALFAAVGARMSYHERLGLTQSLGSGKPLHFKSLLKAVLLITFGIEAIGALLLFVKLQDQFAAPDAAFHAVFHAVSAFCNAGFSTFSTNLEAFHNDIPVILIIGSLIVAGGLGFAVIRELADRAIHPRSTLSLHSKLSIISTTVLLAAGTVIFYLVERRSAYAGMSLGDKLANAFFQSVTPRTAGFDTIAQGSLTDVSILIIIILMFIGACPGSTGGGIKATTMSVISLLVWNRFVGRSSVTAFRRSITVESIVQAITVFILASLVILLMFGALMFVQERATPHSAGGDWFVQHLFETVSAFGTVGLSLGLTPSLSTGGKIVIILTMFIGRVGLLTLAFALARLPKRGEIVFSEESVMVG
ncbi:MAG: TrkH family potassium uptake protein [Candidatus Zixiibacteriota bacterium]